MTPRPLNWRQKRISSPPKRGSWKRKGARSSGLRTRTAVKLSLAAFATILAALQVRQCVGLAIRRRACHSTGTRFCRAGSRLIVTGGIAKLVIAVVIGAVAAIVVHSLL